ncbi:hypothetical protein [Acinetobacter pittii]|uniref:hypothetical protein n=1 Tax=Acinetobacter pittii TaxID=48296 RepID=UPI00300C5BF3
MEKYFTSNVICKKYKISKRTLSRWEIMTPWGIPFPAPAFGNTPGAVKRYLTIEVKKWERKCFKKNNEDTESTDVTEPEYLKAI